RHRADLRPYPAGLADLLDPWPGDLRGADHVRLPAVAPLVRRQLGTAACRVDLPGRAERVPVLPAHLLTQRLGARGSRSRPRARSGLASARVLQHPFANLTDP